MKLLAVTTGDFQLRVEDTAELVRSHGASVLRPSPWLGQQIAASRVEVLERVGDEATQVAWDDTIKQSDGNQELARAAFASEFPVGVHGDGAAAGANAVLPTARAVGVANPPANASGQTAGLAPDEKPGAPGTPAGPGGPKDTNVPPKHHASPKK